MKVYQTRKQDATGVSGVSDGTGGGSGGLTGPKEAAGGMDGGPAGGPGSRKRGKSSPGQALGREESPETALEAQSGPKTPSRRLSGSIRGFREDGSPYCLLENFLRTRQVNLIAGPTHSGKSTLIDHLLGNWALGDPVFGKTPYPLSWWYYSMNKSSDLLRSLRFLHKTGRHTGIGSIPENADGGLKLVDLKDYANRRAREMFERDPERWELGGGSTSEFEEVRVLVIEEINSMMDGDSNRDSDVRRFVTSLVEQCGRMDLTIIGSMSSSKWRKNDRVLLSVERLKGSTDWGSCAADILYIEHENPGMLECPRRKIDIVSRSREPERFSMEFKGQDNDGYPNVKVSKWYGKESGIDAAFRILKKGDAVTVALVKEWCKEEKVSGKTGYRWLKKAEQLGSIRRVRTGVYEKVK